MQTLIRLDFFSPSPPDRPDRPNTLLPSHHQVPLFLVNRVSYNVRLSLLSCQLPPPTFFGGPFLFPVVCRWFFSGVRSGGGRRDESELVLLEVCARQGWRARE